MKTREHVLARIREMPSLPASTTRVLQIAQDPDAGISEIMRVIEYDPLLTTELLRLANTPYFAGPRSVASLREAGVLFGTQRILQLVLASALFPIARAPVAGYDMPAGQLIRHCMAVAIGAEQLASLCGRSAPSHTFTAGLLADIGKIVLGGFLDVDAGAIVRLAAEENLSFEVAERRILGIDHAEVGALLLDCWQVPKAITEVVRWHHDPEQSSGDSVVLDLVHVASHLSTSFGLGGDVDGLNYRLCSGAMLRLRVSQDTLERAACNMLTGLAQIEHQLPKVS